MTSKTENKIKCDLIAYSIKSLKIYDFIVCSLNKAQTGSVKSLSVKGFM